VPLIDEEVLKLDLAVDASGAIQGLRKVDAAFSRSMRDINAQTERLNKLNRSYFGGAITGWRKWRKEAKTVADLPGKLTQQMKINIETIKKKRAESRNMSGEELKAHKSRIQQLLRENVEIRRTQKQIAAVGQETVNIKLKEAGDDLAKSLTDAAEPFAAIFQKDLPKAVKTGGVMFGRVVEKTFLGLGKKSGKLGGFLSRKGGALAGASKAKGGTGAMGGAMKAMGGMFAKMGPMIQTLSTLGPIIGIAAGALAAVVKLLIDAEAQAKEFQKELLTTASTGEFLAKAGNSSVLAFEDLKDTVKDLRDSAYEVKNNLDWGTTAKDHLAFRNVLTQEGVSIKRMADEFKEAQKAGTATADAVRYYSQQTATAVAFSRNFGVQLNELGQFQADLMTDMGMSFDSVNKHFATMAQSASESGMAMNKFFAIMRGVSTDLSLYNMRMDQASRLLGRLGKAMSPQTAQKFMSTLAQGFKNMGRLEKLRMTLLAGEGKTKKIVAKDIAQKKAALAAEMGDRIKGGKKQADQLLEAYMKGGKGAGGKLSKALKGVEGGGALRERASRMKFQQKMSGKGTFGLAQSIGDLGIEGMIDMQKAALGRFAKPGASLADMMGELGPEMMAENMGISQEQLTQMAMMEDAINETREDLIAQANGDTDKINKINAMSGDELLKESGIDAEKALSTQKDFAQRQTELTTSLLQKLDIIIQFLMNELYNVFMSIWDTISDLPGLGGEKRKLEIAVAKTKNPEMMALLKSVDGNPEAFRKALADSPVVKQLTSSATSTFADPKELDARLKKIGEDLSDSSYEADKMAGGSGFADEQRARLREEKKSLEEEKKKAEAGVGARKALQGGAGRSTIQTALIEGLKASGELNAGGEISRHGGRIDKDLNLAQSERLGRIQTRVNAGEDLSKVLESEGLNENATKAVWDALMKAMASGELLSALPPGMGSAAGLPGAPGETETGQRPGVAPGESRADGGAAAGGKSGADLANQYFGGGGGGGTAPGKPPPAPEAVEEGTVLAAENLEVANGQFNSMQDINSALRKTGIRMDRGYYKNNIGPIIEDATYAAMQKALYEFWLYSADPEDIEKKLAWAKENKIDIKDPKSFAKGVADTWSKDGKNPFGPGVGGGTATGADPPKGGVQVINGVPVASTADGHAAGGYVTGIKGGMAMVKSPAPGEGWASIGPGERILPAGAGAPPSGGRSSLAITVDVTGQQGPGFNRYLENVIRNAIYDYEAKKRVI
jgi:hypothetical protein